ncbi:MAG: hypothetical protein VB012_04960 [Erysipelotrichaceae bacterium]|nr:hypothetical protein [Erysipelotrichaceae bacterium]
MRKICQTLIITWLFLWIAAIGCLAQDQTFTINELIENAVSLDGTNVTIEGEAIGEILERGEYSWININDKTNAIGVWIKTSDAQKITYFGDYKNQGDTVRITGTFYNACSEHGGDTDIHAASIEIIQTGNAVSENISPIKILSAGILLVTMLITATAYLRLKKKQTTE